MPSAKWSVSSPVARVNGASPIDARKGDAAGAQRLEALPAALTPGKARDFVPGLFKYFVVSVIDSAGQLLAESPT